MLSNIFRKTLYERRFSTYVWIAIVAGFTLLTMAFYPTLRDSLGETLKDVPESMKGVLGSAQDYQTITGYVDLQVIAQLIFLTVIMAVITGTSLLAGEESSGTLLTLLAQPLKRTQVYIQKFLALIVLTAGVSFGLFIGVCLGLLALHESMSILRLLLATVMIWILTLFFATMAYSIGAMTGSRAAAGIITGAYAFLGYMLTALAGTSKALERLNYVSPFYYFNHPSVLKNGLDIPHLLVLLVAIVVFFVAGIAVFRKRDIYQK